MYVTEFLNQPATAVGQLVRGNVVAMQRNGKILVTGDDTDFSEVLCDLLQTGEGTPLQLASGDNVLVWLPGQDVEKGVVLGRIGPSLAKTPKTENASQVPDELVVEAKQQLTFKCGEGAITLRGDGKILIKGKDLVSRAQRTNRIKGGAVAIN